MSNNSLGSYGMYLHAFAISRGDESEAAVALLGPLRHRHVALPLRALLSQSV